MTRPRPTLSWARRGTQRDDTNRPTCTCSGAARFEESCVAKPPERHWSGALRSLSLSFHLLLSLYPLPLLPLSLSLRLPPSLPLFQASECSLY
mmetsp:Transcript_20125/g.51239  ORF Transcript_20125/g.51239 Transcript_20125/m.51239 type:complete len:93 (+) Transcript_20125:59-337(+)